MRTQLGSQTAENERIKTQLTNKEQDQWSDDGFFDEMQVGTNVKAGNRISLVESMNSNSVIRGCISSWIGRYSTEAKYRYLRLNEWYEYIQQQ